MRTWILALVALCAGLAFAPVREAQDLDEDQQALLEMCRSDIDSRFMRGSPPRGRTGVIRWSRRWVPNPPASGEIARLQRLAEACVELAADVDWFCPGPGGVVVDVNRCVSGRGETNCRLEWSCQL